MQITYRLTDDDIKKYLSTNFIQKKKSALKLIFIISVIVLILIMLMALIAKDYYFATCILLFLIFLFVLLKLIPQHIKKKYIKTLTETGSIDELRTIELKDNEVIVSSPSRTSTFKYSEIANINLINNYFVFIEFKLGDNLIVPGSAFLNDTDRIDFINNIKSNAKIL